MDVLRRLLPFCLAPLLVLPLFAGDEPTPGTSFEMVALVETPTGGRQLGLKLQIRRFASPEELRRLRTTLAETGQEDVLAAIKQRSDGEVL